jgi:hypothetical protein
MKKTFILLAAMLTATLAFTQTTAVITGTLVDQSETGTSAGISLDVTLMNTGSQRCFVNGVGSLVREKQTYTAAQALAGITLAKTASIVCGSSSGQTRWRFSFKNSQLNTSRDCDLQITGNTSLDAATCLQAAATPPNTPVPTASLFLLLDGSNSMTGNLIPAVTATQSIGTSGARWNMFANTLNVASTLGVTGTSTLADVNLGTANTLGVTNIKPQAGAGFNIFDPNGADHFFISSTAPYINTFIAGNGSGGVFLGSAAKALVSDTNGAITTAGGLTLQNTSQLLPATVANNAAGGVTTTSNGGKSLQWTNSGVLIVNPAATSSGAALTVGGTSASTGGLSVFVGASGSATETIGNYPADGSSAPLRIQSLSIRTPSGGLLTGTENLSISNAGIITGATLAGTTPFRRLRANQGTALVNGDVSGISNFGTTASVSSVSGTDAAGSVAIASAGTGQAANGTFTLTFHDGTWTTAPICVANRSDGSGPNSAPVATSQTATTILFVFSGTAVAGTTYGFNFICVGKP